MLSVKSNPTHFIRPCRTLTPNSGHGTDHGWSGHSFILGGEVDGGRVIGEFPSDLTEDSPLNVGRGRFAPTLPFDSIWNGVSDWLGVNDVQDMKHVLPNKSAFPDHLMLKANDLFTRANDDTEAVCNDGGESISCIPGGSCSDLPGTVTFTTSYEITKSRGCDWAKRQATQTRCQNPAIIEHCPKTCTNCCQDTEEPFPLNKNSEMKTCSWAAQNPLSRCRNPPVALMCSVTCGLCESGGSNWYPHT